MSYTNRPPSKGSAKRPAQSMDGMAPNKKKNSNATFPAVGMTLSSYSGSNQGRQRKRPTVDAVEKPSRWARFKSKFTKKRVILTLVALILLAVGWFGWKVVYNAQRLFGGNVFSALTSEKLDGESTGRVNILLAGNSADDAGHQGGLLTDSIMILSISTKDKTGYMLSIPRDLYVEMPGGGHQKINAVYPTGEKQEFSESGYADGGMGLLQKTIKEDLGISTQYYALVNYNALRDAVNSVGGVDITIQSTDKRGLYDPSKDYTTGGKMVKLTNGWHHLSGQQALNLARARGDAYGSYGFAGSDFTRTEHQRQLILALRSKATSAGVLTNPIKLGNLFDSVGNNVETSMSLGNVRRLYEITKDVQGAGIKSVGLNDADGENLLANYRNARGESALIPAAGLDDYSDIRKYLQRISSSSAVVRENATVVVLNGTSTSGLAARESDKLDNKNINVDSVGDADTDEYAVTQIIDNTGGKMPGTKALLKKIYPKATFTTTNQFGAKYVADFIVVIGAERIPATTSSSTTTQ